MSAPKFHQKFWGGELPVKAAETKHCEFRRPSQQFDEGGAIKVGVDLSQSASQKYQEEAKEEKSILDILVAKKIIYQSQVDQLRAKAKKEDRSVEEILVESEIVPEQTMVKAYALLYHLPFVNLGDYHIPYKVITKIPEEMARHESIVAFEAHDNLIKVAVARPHRLKKSKKGVIARYKEKAGVDVKLYLATKKEVEEAFKYYHQADSRRVVVQHGLNPPKPQAPKTVLRNILDVLLAQKAIDQKQFKQVKDKAVEQRKSFEDILRSDKIVSQEILAKSLGFLYRLPYISLRNVDIPYPILARFPENIATEYQMIVFDAIGGNVLKVATAKPENHQVKEIIDFIRSRNNVEVDLFVTTAEDVQRSLTGYKKAPKKPEQIHQIVKEAHPEPEVFQPRPKMVEEDKPVSAMGKEDVKEAIGDVEMGKLLQADVVSLDQLKQIIAQGLVPKIVAAAINFALKRRASDVHIEPTDDQVRLRYRIDGILRDIALIPSSLQAAVVSRIKIAAHLRIDEQRIPQDGRFDVSFGDHAVDIRVSCLPTVRGEKVVMRLLDKSKGIISLEKLGLRGEAYKTVIKNIKKPYGMVLSTGPTGSGKTTTLYAAIQYINSSEINIVTLEDPVEYEIEGVNHCQARAEIGFSFAEGLRSILRQDPNVIMIGEIRDKETAGMAVHSALTGHLVLSTLHTNDAGGAVPRLIDMGVEPFLITSSTNLVIAQRLVRKVCPRCREKVNLPPTVLTEIDEEMAKISPKAKVKIKKPYSFSRGRGCNQCTGGYSGRIGIYEVLEMTPKLDRISVKGASGSDITKAAVEEGMITMKQDGILKAIDGVTSIDEVLRVTAVAE